MADAIWRSDATRMAESIVRKQISSGEAVEACLARIDAPYRRAVVNDPAGKPHALTLTTTAIRNVASRMRARIRFSDSSRIGTPS
jgi:Asp-tRNA(Asn)/Glu-tRNA(Gln) amidotransferase A subunit family amidase